MAGLLLHVVQTPYRFLNIAPVVWLGRISYSLYLWQQPFFLAPPGQPAYRLLFGIGLACLSYYLVEQPVLRLRERRAARLNNIAVAADATQVPCEPARA
jgi:peptidoglycan/LPS O-acetylase OafA/YrhL